MFEQYKMVMVVRADLKMGKGKVAAQVRLRQYLYNVFCQSRDNKSEFEIDLVLNSLTNK